jgi:D-alanine-D-alanine ligase
VARDAGLPIVSYVSLKHELWEKEKEQSAKRIEKELGYPVFVKPANLGSSVGVHKVTEQSRLNSALEDAFKYDKKVLVEAAVNAREIEVSVLENPDVGADPLVSVPGEIDPTHEFYSYEAKYLDEKGATLLSRRSSKPSRRNVCRMLAEELFQLSSVKEWLVSTCFLIGQAEKFSSTN